MPVQQLTADDVTTTNTLEVWRDKLYREDRSKKEWHHRFGENFGLEPRPRSADPLWQPMVTPPEMPPPGRVPQLVEPTASALKYDAAIGRQFVPMRPPSNASSNKSGVSLPSMKTISITSSADRRRELLVERHSELQAQLQLVEKMLAEGKPSTMLSMQSGYSAYSAASAASAASRISAASKHSTTSHGNRSVASSHRSRRSAAEPAPLMLDKRSAEYHNLSPFKSVTGANLAVPGANLSSSFGAGH